MKNTNEFRKFVGSALNSGAEILEDGKIRTDDLLKAIDTISTATPAFQEFGEIDNELAVASLQERNVGDQVFAGELNEFNTEDTRDLIKIENGIFALVSLIARRSYQNGQQSVIKKLELGANVDTIIAEHKSTAA